MANLINNQNEATKFFSSFFTILKKQIRQHLDNKSDDQLPYRSIAFRDAINSSPWPVSLLKLNVDQEKYPQAESDIYYLIKFDIFCSGEYSVDHYGEYSLENIGDDPKLIETFALNKQRIKDIKASKKIIYKEEGTVPWLWYWFVPCQSLTTAEGFARDFLTFFEITFNDKIQEVFGKEINYSIKYGLQNDPVRSPNEFLQIDKTVSSIFKPRSAKENDQILENLQRHICKIQLSPKIPEDVEKVFDAAKKLYVFGYFEYYFFTISKHYSFLALESALRNKYNELNGKPDNHLPLHKIIKKLVKEKVIREADEYFYLSAKNLRNNLSHLTRPPILRPSARILENTAFFINQLYEEDKYK